jgi:peroxiredoxin
MLSRATVALWRVLLLTLIAMVGAFQAGAEPAEMPEALPEKVENFRLIDHNGRSWELYDEEDADAVVLYIHGCGCPIVRQSVPAFNRLKEAFAEKGVVFFMLNANPQDTRKDAAEEAADFEVQVPILTDPTQAVARSLGCERTAEAIVIDPQDDWRIVFRGPVDDRFDYGARKAEADNTWLQSALEKHLAGETVEASYVPTKGCLINFLSYDDVSYATDIAPIIASKCVSCHEDGGVGPFEMSSHRKVKGWSSMMRETIMTKRMPPWHADRETGPYANDRALTVEEEAKLVAWLEAGAPKAEDEADPLAERADDTQQKWALGEPDVVLQLPDVQHIPAEGVVDYKYIPVTTELTEPKWVKAVEVRPTNKEVVHHALIFVTYPREYEHLQPESRSGLSGYFAGYLPGAEIVPYPEGTGQFLPPKSTFIFQMHYNPSGRAGDDQTEMGLYFHDTPPDEALIIRAASETDFTIPPHARDKVVTADYRFREPAKLWGVAPHMHYRGSWFRYDIRFPDQEPELLANVPWYEFDWQPMYYFNEAIEVPENTRILCEGGFDNSRFNPKNPNPEQQVYFGEQSYEEMFIGYMTVSYDYQPGDFAPKEINTDDIIGYGIELNEKTLPGSKWRITRRIVLHFLEEGKITDETGYLKGTWEIDGSTLKIDSPVRNVELSIAGDSLLFRGRPLRRVE